MPNDQPLTISSVDFQRNIGKYQDEALKRPVAITKNGRRRMVLLAAEEYDRLKRRDRQVMTPGDWTPEQIAALAASKVPPGHEHLDEELAGWVP